MQIYTIFFFNFYSDFLEKHSVDLIDFSHLLSLNSTLFQPLEAIISSHLSFEITEKDLLLILFVGEEKLRLIWLFSNSQAEASIAPRSQIIRQFLEQLSPNWKKVFSICIIVRRRFSWNLNPITHAWEKIRHYTMKILIDFSYLERRGFQLRAFKALSWIIYLDKWGDTVSSSEENLSR